MILGTGTGSFGSATVISVGLGPYAVINVDFDGDGKPDLAAANAGTNNVSILLNCNTTGISQISGLDSQISFYPNPSTGIFTIETNSTAVQTLHVYDVNGRIVLTQPINSKATVDMANLPAGVYNINLASNEGIVNKRMIIAK